MMNSSKDTLVAVLLACAAGSVGCGSLTETSSDTTKIEKIVIQPGDNVTKILYKLLDEDQKALVSTSPELRQQLLKKIAEENKLDDNYTLYADDTLIIDRTNLQQLFSRYESASSQESSRESAEKSQESLQQRSQKDMFASYLSTIDIRSYDRNSSYGKYLRSLRRYSDIVYELKKTKSPLEVDYVLALLMQESYGDPLSVNSHDGGVGVFQMQADVAEYEHGLKTFTSKQGFQHLHIAPRKASESYRQYSQRRNPLYKSQGKELMNLKILYQNNYTKLSQLDDRFNIKKNVHAGIDILNKNYRYARSYKFSSHFQKEHHLNTLFAKKNNLDVWQLYALNAYNKGRGSFLRNFRGSSSLGGNHITAIMRHIQQTRNFTTILEQGIAQGLAGDKLLNFLTHHAKQTGHLKPVETRATPIDRQTEQKLLKQSDHILHYIGTSRDQRYDIYSYLVQQGGNPGGVINQTQILLGKDIDAQVSDEHGRIHDKRVRFEKGTKVYVRVKRQ